MHTTIAINAPAIEAWKVLGARFGEAADWTATMAVAAQTSPFGTLLRQWRRSKGMSQLMLAAEAQTTPRHISFLETRRSRPTDAMVIRLCDALGAQLRERNQLLLGAGLSPRYPEEPFDTPRYRPARAAINRLLSTHEPYAGVVMTRDALVIAANQGAERLFGTDLTAVNMMTWLYQRGDPRETIANWPDVARTTVARLRAEVAQFPLDKNLKTALAAVEGAVEELDSVEVSTENPPTTTTSTTGDHPKSDLSAD